MSQLLEHATGWVERHRASVVDRGVELRVDRSPDGRDNPALWVDFDGNRLVRLTLWASGEAVLAVASVETGSILLEEQLTIANTAAIDDTLHRALTLALGDPPSRG